MPANAQVINATGLMVYPGMIETGSSIGLSEIGQGAVATVDISEVGSFNPNAQAFYGIDPHSAHIGVARVVGITTVVSRPTGGILSGQAALMNLAGDTPPKMAVIPKLALVVELPRSGFGGRGFARAAALQQGAPADANRVRQAQMDSLRKMLRDADAYGKAQDAYAKDKTIPRPAHDVVLESMLPALRGQMPVIFPADRANDIRDAVTFAEEMHLKPIILGGEQSPAGRRVPQAAQRAGRRDGRDAPAVARGRSVRHQLQHSRQARRGGRDVRDLDGRQGIGGSHAARTTPAWPRRTACRRRMRSSR